MQVCEDDKRSDGKTDLLQRVDWNPLHNISVLHNKNCKYSIILKIDLEDPFIFNNKLYKNNIYIINGKLSNKGIFGKISFQYMDLRTLINCFMVLPCCILFVCIISSTGQMLSDEVEYHLNILINILSQFSTFGHTQSP